MRSFECVAQHQAHKHEAVHIYNTHHIHEALAHRDVADVNGPYIAEVARLEISQQVGSTIYLRAQLPANNPDMLFCASCFLPMIWFTLTSNSRENSARVFYYIGLGNSYRS